jgi:hypothetical protein
MTGHRVRPGTGHDDGLVSDYSEHDEDYSDRERDTNQDHEAVARSLMRTAPPRAG